MNTVQQEEQKSGSEPDGYLAKHPQPRVSHPETDVE
jgi:hypothetical protein